jgi:hypothetical protein
MLGLLDYLVHAIQLAFVLVEAIVLMACMFEAFVVDIVNNWGKQPDYLGIE